MSDQDVTRSSIPAVWFERIQQLPAEPGNFPSGVFVSSIQKNDLLQWRVISVQEGIYCGFPPGIFIDTNFTEKLLDEDPNLSYQKMGSVLSILLCDEMYSGIMYRPYGLNPINTVILQVMAPSGQEQPMKVVEDVISKPNKKFHFMDLFRRNGRK